MMWDVPLQTVIALHSEQILSPLLKGIAKSCDSSKKINNKIKVIVFKIYKFCYDCFLSNEQHLSQYFPEEGPLKTLIKDKLEKDDMAISD